MGQKIGRINWVAVLTRFFFFLQENIWQFSPGAKKSERKAGFHCDFKKSQSLFAVEAIMFFTILLVQ